MLLRTQDILNMSDYQRKIIKAYLSGERFLSLFQLKLGKVWLLCWLHTLLIIILFGEDCNVIFCPAGNTIWSARVPFYWRLSLLSPLQWHSLTIRSFPSLQEASEQGFHSCRLSHGTMYSLTNCHWKSPLRCQLEINKLCFISRPHEVVITPKIFVRVNLSRKLTNLPFQCRRNIQVIDYLCPSGINGVKDSM